MISESLKIPPHSVEAEQSVIGGLLLNNLAWERIADKILVEDFYRQDHRLLFEAIGQLEASNQPFDAVTLSAYLKKTHQLEQVGGLAYIGRLAKDTPSAANITAYADIVRERSILRQLIAVGTDIASNAYMSSDKDGDTLLDAAGAAIHMIADRQRNRNSGPQSAATIVPIVITELDDRHANGGGITGIQSGFADLDRKISGLHPGDLVIIAGRPSMGKTTFAMNIAEEVYSTRSKSVLFFSMEMSKSSIIERQLAAMAQIDFQNFRTGRLGDSEFEKIATASSKITAAKFFIDDSAALTVNTIRTRARKIQRQHGVDLVIVDYLQLMRGQGENRTMEITKISQGLKALAKELNVPVIALSQLNRGLENRNSKRPTMSDLRDSGAIEQDADLIVFIYRDEVYNEDSPAKGVAEIIIGKQRNGPTGTIHLTFRGDLLRFADYAGPIPDSSVYQNTPTKWRGGFDYGCNED